MAELPGQLSLFASGAATDTGDARVEPQPSSMLTTDAEFALLPDGAARARIQRDLDTNILVEAGAGAGKTTEMVDRMLALVVRGVAVTQIAAVTFTRKSAAELRQRFQTRLEEALRTARAGGMFAELALIDRALRDIDRAFIGTIHSFCARLLRERPIDAGIDPAFRELQAAEQRQLEATFWHTHLDRLSADGDAQLVELSRAGLKPDQLFSLFHTLVEQPDVLFDAPDTTAPDVAAARHALERWLDAAERLIPREEPVDGWDKLQLNVRRLRYHRHIAGWADPIDFLNALLELSTSATATQKRWADDAAGRAAAKELSVEFTEMIGQDGILGRALRSWRAHRYPIALRFGLRAADAFQAYREREGMLTFQDLLMLAAKLLREHAAARSELGERYRHLLVDEFQDTDPIQAEVVFLLAAGADAPVERGIADWTQATPRPGALFVVGDPKQSIYRFRRADIGIYNQVKQRLRECGAVLELTANFRSRPALAAFVNATFRSMFPAQENARQAAFAPMDAQKSPAPNAGVRWYLLDDGGARGREVMEREDPERVAAWIAERISEDGRQPGDFLLLARMNKFLGAYAAALEARGVPVQVSGGGVGIDHEVEELLIVLRALEDPADETRTLAALVGLFFGLDYEQLTSYARGPADAELDSRRSLDMLKPIPDASALATDDERMVADALRTLRRWWLSLHDEPADVAVGRIVDELGLLPHAAAGTLGETRAGAVLFLLDTLRVAAERGDASLTAALAALEAAFDDDDGEAPLRPGRQDVVRVMTLHKAKGLEAPVVMLVAPFGEWVPPIDRHIERATDGRATGWLQVSEYAGRKTIVHARPDGWSEFEAREQEFADAEAIRLLYVAATRAEEELVIAIVPDQRLKASPWRQLYPTALDHGQELQLPLVDAPARPALELAPGEMQHRIDLVDQRRRDGARPSYRAAPVKLRAGELSEYELRAAQRGHGAVGRGVEWGSAVHGALEAAMRGAEGDTLRAYVRALLIAAERPIGADGEPRETADLLALVAAARASDVWQRAHAADARQIEAPFAVAFDAQDYAEIARTIGAPDVVFDGVQREIVEGVIDLAFREQGEWVVVDYKSDEAGSGIDEARRAKYRAQVELYAAAWERITGESVRQRVLLFTADGVAESW